VVTFADLDFPQDIVPANFSRLLRPPFLWGMGHLFSDLQLLNMIGSLIFWLLQATAQLRSCSMSDVLGAPCQSRDVRQLDHS